MLERGTLLRGGDCLLASDGRMIEVIAAPETVSVVTADDPWGLARAAYHLGNRHISVQVGQGWLRYLHDHVLDDMVRGLGFTVTTDEMPFEPEAGVFTCRRGSASSLLCVQSAIRMPWLTCNQFAEPVAAVPAGRSALPIGAPTSRRA
jgi:urease accessory protein UreE